MIKIKRVTEVYGDETAGYSVELTKNYTVSDFVDDVLLIDGEWGHIGIHDKYSVFGSPECEYSHGKLKTKLPNDIMDKEVLSASAHGGWSRMDYQLKIKQ